MDFLFVEQFIFISIEWNQIIVDSLANCSGKIIAGKFENNLMLMISWLNLFFFDVSSTFFIIIFVVVILPKILLASNIIFDPSQILVEGDIAIVIGIYFLEDHSQQRYFDF